MSIKALLFDFDGVILDSLDVKTQAFYNMYLPHGKEIAQKVADHHLAHGGISRFEKFKYYHQEFLGIPIDDKQVNELADEFSRNVLNGVISSPEIKGIREFLSAFKHLYKMWVITGTPTSEIKWIAQKVKLDKYFVELYGSPEKKDHWTAKILKENNFLPSEVVFIGDATTDYEAAINNKVHFILREHTYNIEFFKDKKVKRIKDFVGFQDVISHL
jgi:HAD superfamily hydrolase (TIGR01549 family)